MSDDLTDVIRENAEGPKQVNVDGVVTEEHSLREQIEADQYLREQAAAGTRKLPIRLARLRAGGP